jgi:hypothetical protein
MAKKQGSTPTILVAIIVAMVSMCVDESVGICLTQEEAVFPYVSNCDAPATYGNTTYWLQSRASGDGSFSFLASEYDETDDMHHVRLVKQAGEAERYGLLYNADEPRPYVGANDTGIIIFNAGSGRKLDWYERGGRQFLIESRFSAALFKFSPDSSANLSCLDVSADARCSAFDVVSSANPSVGLSPYENDGVVYFTASFDDLNPFVLLRPDD